MNIKFFCLVVLLRAQAQHEHIHHVGTSHTYEPHRFTQAYPAEKYDPRWHLAEGRWVLI